MANSVQSQNPFVRKPLLQGPILKERQMPTLEWPCELSPLAWRDAALEAETLAFAYWALWLAAWGRA